MVFNKKDLIIVVLTLFIVGLFVFKPKNNDETLVNEINTLNNKNLILFKKVDSLNKVNDIIEKKLDNLNIDIESKKESIEQLNNKIKEIEGRKDEKNNFVDGLDVIQFDRELTKYLEKR